MSTPGVPEVAWPGAAGGRAAMAHPPRPGVGIVVPLWNEAHGISGFLAALPALGPMDELIFVDGGSTDGSRQRLREWMRDTPADPAGPAVRLLRAPRGRARQMNAGAAVVRTGVLLFLHADVRLPGDALASCAAAIARGWTWGRFDVRLDAPRAPFRVIERLMNWRSALTGIATGDQAIFVRRDVWRVLGGYAPIALMEDIDLCRRLKWVGRPARLRTPVLVSARRWERQGVLRTVLRMWSLRLLYLLGVRPARLTRWYDGPAADARAGHERRVT